MLPVWWVSDNQTTITWNTTLNPHQHSIGRSPSLRERLSCTDFWGLLWWWWCWWFLMSWIWNLETKVWILALPFSSVCLWLLSPLVSLNLNFFSYKNGGCFKQYGTWIFESTLHIVNACYDAYFLKITKKILLQCICVIRGATTVLRFHCFIPLADSLHSFPRSQIWMPTMSQM